MFGMGGSEIIVILVVALLFLGPDKLPEVTKAISKGVRDLKKQSRTLQQTIENDEHIGGAIRDLKSALRGDEIPVRPPVRKQLGPQPTPEPKPAEPAAAVSEPEPALTVTLPETAGEPDPDVKTTDAPEELAAMIRPAPGTVAQGSSEPEPEPAPAPKQKHG